MNQTMELISTKGKNENDVKALKQMIAEQNALGAGLPADIDHWRYIWRNADAPRAGTDDKESMAIPLRGTAALTTSSKESYLAARLTELHIADCGLSGTLSLSALGALEVLSCAYNRLKRIDIGSNPALRYLYCYCNRLESLDVRNSPALIDLNCSNNRIAELDVSANSGLEFLRCYNNRIRCLDVSGSPMLRELDARENRLSTLNIGSGRIWNMLEYDQLQEDYCMQ